MNTHQGSNPSSAGQASNNAWPIKTFKDRNAWIELLFAANRDTLGASEKIVGARIALHHNVDTGQCNPSIGKLVFGTSLSESTVRRMIQNLERAGWLLVDRTRGRHANSFELRAPTLSRMKGFNPVSTESVQDNPTLSEVAPQPCQNQLNPVTADTGKRNLELRIELRRRKTLLGLISVTKIRGGVIRRLRLTPTPTSRPSGSNIRRRRTSGSH
ncbi:helix-turn-helix domain-containing protein [Bradyrhizobium vignae]|uniref:helix-turn-helix domain-containing protein n=1 Tax=Bradyrhizobium vignae TaxID=1549949 RepID=UPI0013E8DA00|nr:helix-turn-helix domain-containing protein [Bradyrhizobium vignae]